MRRTTPFQWAFLILLTSLSYSAFAQPVFTEIADAKKNRVIADSCIQVLKGGALIIRLPAYADKIAAFEQELKGKSLSKSKRKRLQKRYDRTIRDRDRFNMSIIEAFHEHYAFSSFLVTYDVHFEDFINGKRSGIFLNKNLEIDPTITLDTDNFLILRYGYTNYATTTRQVGFIFTDAKRKDLPRPFPVYHDTENALKVFLLLFSPNSYTSKSGKQIVNDIQERLTGY